MIPKKWIFFFHACSTLLGIWEFRYVPVPTTQHNERNISRTYMIKGFFMFIIRSVMGPFEIGMHIGNLYVWAGKIKIHVRNNLWLLWTLCRKTHMQLREKCEMDFSTGMSYYNRTESDNSYSA